MIKIFAFTLLTVLCLPNISNAQETKKFLDIKEVTSPAGIKAWLVEDHSIPVISLEYAFRDTGAKNDPQDKQGLSQLASNTMDEGSGSLTSEEFQKRLQDQSISLTFDSNRDTFGGNLKTLTTNKESAFQLLNLALTQPRFDEEPVERMKAANLSRIKSSMTNPEWIAARLQNDRIFEGHAYSRNSGGTLSSLASITPADLKSFHKTLGKNNLVIAVAGDISAAELSTKLDEIFGGLPEVPSKPSDKTTLKNAGKTYIFKKDIPQTIIEIAQTGVSREDPDYHAAQLMNYILGGSGFGSRLTEEIREKRGLTYGIYSYFQEYEATKAFHISTSTENKNVSDMIALIKTEWQKMKQAPVTDKELQDAKSYLIGSMPLSLTSTNAIASLLLSLQLDKLPVNYLDTREKTLRGITPEDIQKTAQRLLDEESFTTILVGQPDGIKNADIIETIPNVE